MQNENSIKCKSFGFYVIDNHYKYIGIHNKIHTMRIQKYCKRIHYNFVTEVLNAMHN